MVWYSPPRWRQTQCKDKGTVWRSTPRWRLTRCGISTWVGWSGKVKFWDDGRYIHDVTWLGPSSALSQACPVAKAPLARRLVQESQRWKKCFISPSCRLGTRTWSHVLFQVILMTLTQPTMRDIHVHHICQEPHLLHKLLVSRPTPNKNSWSAWPDQLKLVLSTLLPCWS